MTKKNNRTIIVKSIPVLILFVSTLNLECLCILAWQQSPSFSTIPSRKINRYNEIYDNPITSSFWSTSSDVIEDVESITPPCYYKSGNRWKQRIQLDELKVGQKIFGERISNADLLSGKTGPKVFFECGVGRLNGKGKWKMVSGMLRVAKNYAKPKVVKKKIQRLSGQPVELYVHKIRLSEGKLEVCTTLEELERQIEKSQSQEQIVSISSLEQGQGVIGTVVQVRPYGVMVDVGANRRGLLHIQKVADLYGRYIDKEDGLIEVGLERGAKLKLEVSSIEKKRLFLDFTEDTKELAMEDSAEAGEEIEGETKAVEERKEDLPQSDNDIEDDDKNVVPEASAWSNYYEDYADDYANDNEDRDIEDAMGLGSY